VYTRILHRARSETELQELQEFFFTELRLLQDPMFHEGRRQILVVNRDSDTQIRPSRMEKPRVASFLMVNVEPSTLERSHDSLGFERWKPRRHAGAKLRDSDRYPFRRDFRDVARDGLTGLQGAFQVAANCISRHFASFFKSLTIGADLRDCGHEHVEPAFG